MNKKFNCVEMKHRGAEQLLEELSGLTPEQELEFWQKKTKGLKKLRQRLLSQKEKFNSDDNKPLE